MTVHGYASAQHLLETTTSVDHRMHRSTSIDAADGNTSAQWRAGPYMIIGQSVEI
jgi:hypothetical protein